MAARTTSPASRACERAAAAGRRRGLQLPAGHVSRRRAPRPLPTSVGAPDRARLPLPRRRRRVRRGGAGGGAGERGRRDPASRTQLRPGAGLFATVARAASAARRWAEARAADRARRVAAADHDRASAAADPRPHPLRRLPLHQPCAARREGLRVSALHVLQPVARHPSTRSSPTTSISSASRGGGRTTIRSRSRAVRPSRGWTSSSGRSARPRPARARRRCSRRGRRASSRPRRSRPAGSRASRTR